MKFIDDKNRIVEIPENPERIISLSPSITETLFRIGKGNSVIGVTPFCVRPAEARKIKKIGSYGYARIDLIEGLKPDVILIVSGYQDKLGDELFGKFPVFTISLPFSVFSILDLILKTGIVVNRVDESRSLARDMFEILQSIQRVKGSPKLYYEIDLGGPVTFGSLSYINQAFEFLGFKTFGSGIRKEWFVPDFNEVMRFDPDLIIFEPKMFSKNGKSFYLEELRRRKWEIMKASKEEKIFITPSEFDFFAHHGPSFIEEALPWVSKLI